MFSPSTPPAPAPLAPQDLRNRMGVDVLLLVFLGMALASALRQVFSVDGFSAHSRGAWGWVVLLPVAAFGWLAHLHRRKPPRALHPTALVLWGIHAVLILWLTARVGVSAFWVTPLMTLGLYATAMLSTSPKLGIGRMLLAGAWVLAMGYQTWPGLNGALPDLHSWPREVAFNLAFTVMLAMLAQRLMDAVNAMGQAPEGAGVGAWAAETLAQLQRRHEHSFVLSAVGLAGALTGVHWVLAYTVLPQGAPTVVGMGAVVGGLVVLGTAGSWYVRGRLPRFTAGALSLVAILVPHLAVNANQRLWPVYSMLCVYLIFGMVWGDPRVRWLVWLSVTLASAGWAHRLGLSDALPGAGSWMQVASVLIVGAALSVWLNQRDALCRQLRRLTDDPANATALCSATTDPAEAPLLDQSYEWAQRRIRRWGVGLGLLTVGLSLGAVLLWGHRDNLLLQRVMQALPVVLLSGLWVRHLTLKAATGMTVDRLAASVNQQQRQLALQRRLNDLRTQNTALHDSLQRALAVAEQENRSKSLFVLAMSHQIRTPMHGLLTYLDLLKDQPLDPQARAHVASAQRSTGMLGQILNDVLDLSHLESGEVTLTPMATDMRQTLQDVVNLLTTQADAKHVTLALHLDPALPPLVWVDGGRLRQVVMNLVSNAIKFTPDGRVDVYADRLSDPERLRIRVVDTGIGMTPEFVAQCTQPFTQAHSGISRQYGGTGLGLSISHQLVQRMGGKGLQVSSEIDLGSTFAFEWPLTWPPARGVTDDPAPETARPLPDLRGLTLLLVEDEPTNIEAQTLMLEHMGAAVHIATHGDDALDALTHMSEQGRRYDAVLMDIYMPSMDGLSCTRAIRQRPEWAGLPVVAISAGASAEEQTLGVEAGVDAFVAKPFDRAELLAALGRLLPAGDRA